MLVKRALYYGSAIVLFLCLSPTPTLVAAGTTRPVVIELFTSEGCSSCPPADALLTQLDRQHTSHGAEVLVLGEHVDYWNHLGWTDRFSTPVFSRRQNDYATRFRVDSVYTPQMVIDGHIQLVGNDSVAVNRAIAQAAIVPKTAQISLEWAEAGELHVSVRATGAEHPQIWLAVAEDGLSTSVTRGENGGRVLRHSGVVRQLVQLGTGDLDRAIPVRLKPEWNPQNCKIVVFAQEPGNGAIIGAGSTRYANP
jgi:hypothetical protein